MMPPYHDKGSRTSQRELTGNADGSVQPSVLLKIPSIQTRRCTRIVTYSQHSRLQNIYPFDITMGSHSAKL